MPDTKSLAELDHAYQYRMLREEILDQVGETRRLEIYTLGALGLFYAWLLTHGVSVGGRAVYWLAPAFVALAAVRTWAALARISEVAAYLREIEIAAFGRIDEHSAVTEPPRSVLDSNFQLSDLYRADILTYNGAMRGWEQHVQTYGSHLVNRSSLAFWLLVFFCSILAALILPDLAPLRP
jgi:hypothetical protein